MGRYINPKCRLCRREGKKLFLKGDRCFTERCAFERRKEVPGSHGGFRQKRLSEYGLRLREKQKAKRIFGISEKQFRRTYGQAVKAKSETSGVLFQKLELRFDSVVYNMGLATSRTSARQLISHRHFLLNNKPVNVPSCELKEGDLISVVNKSKGNNFFKQILETTKKGKSKRELPAWISFDSQKMEGKILYIPTLKELDVDINAQYIIEFYSR